MNYHENPKLESLRGMYEALAVIFNPSSSAPEKKSARVKRAHLRAVRSKPALHNIENLIFYGQDSAGDLHARKAGGSQFLEAVVSTTKH